MAKQSQKSSFESHYSSGFVTFVQWHVEQICQRKATAEKQGRLPVKFWGSPEWSTHFRHQVSGLHSVLKTAKIAANGDLGIAEAAVSEVFNHREYLWVLSFRTPKFIAAVRTVVQKMVAIAAHSQPSSVGEDCTISRDGPADPPLSNLPVNTASASTAKSGRARFAALDAED